MSTTIKGPDDPMEYHRELLPLFQERLTWSQPLVVEASRFKTTALYVRELVEAWKKQLSPSDRNIIDTGRVGAVYAGHFMLGSAVASNVRERDVGAALGEDMEVIIDAMATAPWLPLEGVSTVRTHPLHEILQQQVTRSGSQKVVTLERRDKAVGKLLKEKPELMKVGVESVPRLLAMPAGVTKDLVRVFRQEVADLLDTPPETRLPEQELRTLITERVLEAWGTLVADTRGDDVQQLNELAHAAGITGDLADVPVTQVYDALIAPLLTQASLDKAEFQRRLIAVEELAANEFYSQQAAGDATRLLTNIWDVIKGKRPDNPEMFHGISNVKGLNILSHQVPSLASLVLAYTARHHDLDLVRSQLSIRKPAGV